MKLSSKSKSCWGGGGSWKYTVGPNFRPWLNAFICGSRSWCKDSWMETNPEVTIFSLKVELIFTIVVPGWRAAYSLWSRNDVYLSQWCLPGKEWGGLLNGGLEKEININHKPCGRICKLGKESLVRTRKLSTIMYNFLEKNEDKRRRGWQRMSWLDGITDSTDMNLSKLRR